MNSETLSKAVCGQALAIPEAGSGAGSAPEWVHIMPTGAFAGRDGRGRIRKEQAQAEANHWTIGKLWDAYKENNSGLKGIVTDKNRFKNYLSSFAKLAPEELSTQMVDSLRLKLMKSGKKAGTTKNVLELLRRIINFGVKKGLCAWQDPSRLHFEMPKLNNVKTEMLTKDERARFIEAAQAAPNRKAGQLMLIAYYSRPLKTDFIPR